MDDECLSLTWNNHGATYRQTLSVLREENTLTDVTLACDGQKFSAHKLVLVTCSDYFRSILGDVPCQHPIVYMRGVTAREMQALINFMYTGQTDVPQKEVPTLLSTAEALQIKGLGVFNPSGEDGKVNKSQKDKNTVNKKRRVDSSSVFNGSLDESKRSDASTSLSREDNFLENLYSHHYALLSSPKRRKNEESVISGKGSEYGASCEGVAATTESSPRKESEDSSNCVTPTSLPSSTGRILDTFMHHRQVTSKVPSRSSTTASAPPSPRNRPMSEEIGSATVSSLSLDIAKQRTSDKHSSPSSTGQQNLHNPTRPEAKAASPRALNYSIAGLGGNKSSYSTGALGHMSEESSTVPAETPENLMKTEIKEEALDFSSTTLSENHQSDSVTPSAGSNSIEEEARMYLDAFTRSANLNWQQTPDEPLETAATDGRPFVCPICQKSFAKAAILKRHHLAHFRPYVCHICTRSFTRREVLAEHLLEHNGADLRMPCPVCAMTIKRKRNLQAHIKVKHPDYYRQKLTKKEATC
ncbi:hypothetical protein Pcinc_039274 [Petrolisthes cinctipes]|uniref:Uncharacterized protein n=1 Tax=Petrolisthes cinctipes TaxID=88211 RepID=A0AAE1EJN9_PETCI|nr:hypothetical protein Pcinc_039274 [Petrolisthes cinctipes]